MREKNDFQVNGANSYSCVTKQSYPFVSRVEMELSHYKAQAFRTITEKDFSTGNTSCIPSLNAPCKRINHNILSL